MNLTNIRPEYCESPQFQNLKISQGDFVKHIWILSNFALFKSITTIITKCNLIKEICDWIVHNWISFARNPKWFISLCTRYHLVFIVSKIGKSSFQRKNENLFYDKSFHHILCLIQMSKSCSSWRLNDQCVK